MPGLSTPTYDATTANTSAAWMDYMPSLPTAVDLINPVIQWVLEPFDLQAPIRLLFCLLLLNLFKKLAGSLLRASARLINPQRQPQRQPHHHTILLHFTTTLFVRLTYSRANESLGKLKRGHGRAQGAVDEAVVLKRDFILR